MKFAARAFAVRAASTSPRRAPRSLANERVSRPLRHPMSCSALQSRNQQSDSSFSLTAVYPSTDKREKRAHTHTARKKIDDLPSPNTSPFGRPQET